MAFQFTSQSKIFIDFGASPAGGIGSGGGALWLQTIANMEITDERDVKIVKAIGVAGGAGYRHVEGGGGIMITDNRVINPAVRWRTLKRNKMIFMLMSQDENGGTREKWFNCTVGKIDRSMSDEGEHQDKVDLKFLSSVES